MKTFRDFLIVASFLISAVGTVPVAHAKAIPRPNCRLSIDETMIPNFSCGASDADCYAQAQKVLQALGAKWQTDLAGCPKPPGESYVSEFDFTGQKSDYVFVYLPGLYTTAAQFWPFEGTMGPNNAMRVTLPGHGASAADGGLVTEKMWQDDVERSLRMATYLGKKIILVGQSTGGFLSVWAATLNRYPIAGVAVFEPALKVRDYYGSSLCYLPPNIDVSHFHSGTFFEEDVNLGCVIRRLSQNFSATLTHADTLRTLSKIPFYVFVNPHDFVVKSQSTVTFVKNLLKAGGQVMLEAYNDNFEGKQNHGWVTYLALRPRFAERFDTATSFNEIIRGRNSYAEFLARNFNLCDATRDPQYLGQFDQAYSVLYPPQRLTSDRLGEVISELNGVNGLQTLSATSQETLKSYLALFEQTSGYRARLSFVTDGSSMLMQEKAWPALHSTCCSIYETTHKDYTTSFEGPLGVTLAQQVMTYRFYLTQAAQGPIDSVVAQKLIGLISGQGADLLVKVVQSDFATSNAAYGGEGKCKAWGDVPSMAISTSFIEAQIASYEASGAAEGDPPAPAPSKKSN